MENKPTFGNKVVYLSSAQSNSSKQSAHNNSQNTYNTIDRINSRSYMESRNRLREEANKIDW